MLRSIHNDEFALMAAFLLLNAKRWDMRWKEPRRSLCFLFTSPFLSQSFHFHRLIIIFMALGCLFHSFHPSFVLIHLIIPPVSFTPRDQFAVVNLKASRFYVLLRRRDEKNLSRGKRMRAGGNFFNAHQTDRVFLEAKRPNNDAECEGKIWIRNELFSMLDDMFSVLS